MTKCNLCGGSLEVAIDGVKRVCPSCHGNQPKELLTLTEYQHQAAKTAVYPQECAIEYTALGLVGEAGEIANKVKKYLRGDYKKSDLPDIVGDEIFDCVWYCSQLARELGLDFGELGQRNLDKLADRKNRGVIKGSGDER